MSSNVEIKPLKINFRIVSFWVGLLIGILFLISTGVAGVNFCVNSMHDSAASKFSERLEPELMPPHGQVYEAIEDAISSHTNETEGSFQGEILQIRGEMIEINLRLQRQEILMSTIYTEITGRQPPPAPGS